MFHSLNYKLIDSNLSSGNIWNENVQLIQTLSFGDK